MVAVKTKPMSFNGRVNEQDDRKDGDGDGDGANDVEGSTVDEPRWWKSPAGFVRDVEVS